MDDQRVEMKEEENGVEPEENGVEEDGEHEEPVILPRIPQPNDVNHDDQGIRYLTELRMVVNQFIKAKLLHTLSCDESKQHPSQRFSFSTVAPPPPQGETPQSVLRGVKNVGKNTF